jgi:hypothetical protein
MILFDWKTRPKTIYFDFGHIWPFGHTSQVDLVTSNLSSDFFTEHKIIFLIG